MFYRIILIRRNIPSSSENYYTGRRGHYRVDSLDGGSILAAQQDAMMRNIFNVHSHHQSSIGLFLDQ